MAMNNVPQSVPQAEAGGPLLEEPGFEPPPMPPQEASSAAPANIAPHKKDLSLMETPRGLDFWELQRRIMRAVDARTHESPAGDSKLLGITGS
ncbi:MAG TPA: hypothetical protein VFL16_17195 [Steroidobacteraceae bacterium]|nr:hypothetical protein [Steroidobacteraceae bacterium]